MMESLARSAGAGGLTLPELAREVMERSGYLDALEAQDTPDAQARRENLEELINGMAEFAAEHEDEDAGLSEFLEQVALMTSEDEAGPAANDQGTLTLMTLHGAKGLEYPVIAICGLEEELFPTMRAIEASRTDPGAVEEERRLCYVGITRARRHLLLTWARWRYLFGQAREMEPSRFLSEIPEELVEKEEVEAQLAWGSPAGAERRRKRQRSGAPPPPARQRPAADPTPKGVHYVPDEDSPAGEDFDADGDPLAVGRWVVHPDWGRGKIVEREGQGEKTKLSIRFGGTTKRVMAAYAGLQPA